MAISCKGQKVVHAPTTLVWCSRAQVGAPVATAARAVGGGAGGGKGIARPLHEDAGPYIYIIYRSIYANPNLSSGA